MITDQEMVRRALKRADQAAYAELMYRYWDAVYYRLLQLVKQPEDAEDLTIETFGKAFKSLASYTSDYAFSTWIYSIAMNHAIDFNRKKRGSTVSLSDGGGEPEYLASSLVSYGLDPEERFIKKEQGDILRAVVERLKPHYRTLIEMRYYQEMSYDEIANELKMPLGTVKVKLFRARELMYQILKPTVQ